MKRYSLNQFTAKTAIGGGVAVNGVADGMVSIGVSDLQ